MHDTSPPAQAPSGIRPIPRAVRNGIASGQRYICTFEDCLGVWSTSWCSRCQAPRCDEHAPDGECSVCGAPVVSFAAITETERLNDARYDLPSDGAR